MAKSGRVFALVLIALLGWGDVRVDAQEPEEQLLEPIVVRGVARNAKGEPVADAEVFLVSTNGIDKRLGKTRTDVDGKYEINAKLPVRDASEGNLSGTIQVYGVSKDQVLTWHGMRFYHLYPRPDHARKGLSDHSFYDGEPLVMDLTFAPTVPLIGKVVDDAGSPIANVHVSISGLDYLNTSDRVYHPNFREFWGIEYAPTKFRNTTTDENGKFEIRGLPAETVGYMRINHPDFARRALYVAITNQSLTEYEFVANSAQSIRNGQQFSSPIMETRKVETTPLDVTLQHTETVTVSVVDHEQNPLRGIRVSASSGDRATGTFSYGKTNGVGRVKLSLPPGSFRLIADPPRDSTNIRTYGKLEVVKNKSDQQHELIVQAGCILILKAVDATSGEPIIGCNFWYEDRKNRRMGVNSSTNYVDHPVTNTEGVVRAVVEPGTRPYGIGWSPLPNGYRADRATSVRKVECIAGEEIEITFELRR